MRNITALCLVSLLASACEEKKPVPVTSKEGGFTVALPPGFPQPKAETKPLKTAAGKVSMISYTSSKDDGTYAGVVYNEFPPLLLKLSSPEKILDGSQKGALKRTGGKLLRQGKTTCAGHPGRFLYFVVTQKGKTGYGRQLVCLANAKLFQLIYIGWTREELDTPEVAAFFKSLQFTGEEPGKDKKPAPKGERPEPGGKKPGSKDEKPGPKKP